MPPYANQKHNDDVSSPRICIDSAVNKPPVRYKLVGERDDRDFVMDSASLASWYNNTQSRNTRKSRQPNHRSIFQRLVDFNPCVEDIQDLIFPLCCTEEGLKRKQTTKESMTNFCSQEMEEDETKSRNTDWSSVASSTESKDPNRGFEV